MFLDTRQNFVYITSFYSGHFMLVLKTPGKVVLFNVKVVSFALSPRQL